MVKNDNNNNTLYMQKTWSGKKVRHFLYYYGINGAVQWILLLPFFFVVFYSSSSSTDWDATKRDREKVEFSSRCLPKL